MLYKKRCSQYAVECMEACLSTREVENTSSSRCSH